MPDSTLEFICGRGISAATPLVLAGVGELIAQRAGVINIGIEGLMLVGALAAYVGAFAAGGWAGVALAALAGMLLAALFALATVGLRADQIVAGTAINFLAVGVAGTIWEIVGSRMPSLPPGAGFSVTPLPLLADIPLLGPVLFDQFTLTYLLGGMVLAAWFVLQFTRAGLIIHSLGDSPDACDAAGVPVRRWRLACVLFAGACAGAAGAYLSIMRTHAFTIGGVGGRGFLVLALVIFGRWNVWGLCAGCFLFGALDALQQFMQAGSRPAWLPLQLFPMLPYLATLVALAALSRHGRGPAYLGRPWPER